MNYITALNLLTTAAERAAIAVKTKHLFTDERVSQLDGAIAELEKIKPPVNKDAAILAYENKARAALKYFNSLGYRSNLYPDAFGTPNALQNISSDISDEIFCNAFGVPNASGYKLLLYPKLLKYFNAARALFS